LGDGCRSLAAPYTPCKAAFQKELSPTISDLRVDGARAILGRAYADYRHCQLSEGQEEDRVDPQDCQDDDADGDCCSRCNVRGHAFLLDAVDGAVEATLAGEVDGQGGDDGGGNQGADEPAVVG